MRSLSIDAPLLSPNLFVPMCDPGSLHKTLFVGYKMS